MRWTALPGGLFEPVVHTDATVQPLEALTLGHRTYALHGVVAGVLSGMDKSEKAILCYALWLKRAWRRNAPVRSCVRRCRRSSA